ncbi:MAG: hypothetical protein LUO89_13810, partial [Methanothrix sp.]|nr:hypothetical protein [Methanothrix sp.]
YVVGIAVGAVGLAGAVDVGTLNNNTVALVDTGAQVTAKKNIGVNALALKQFTGFDVSGAAGLVGVGGTVDVWSIGTKIKPSTTNYDGSSTGSALDASNNSKTGTADGEAASQGEAGTSTTTDAMGKFSGGAEFAGNSTYVNTGSDTVLLGTDAALNTGDKVKYSHGAGGTDIGGLTDGKSYFVRDLGSGSYKLYHTYNDAVTDTNAIDLQSTGSGSHQLIGNQVKFGTQLGATGASLAAPKASDITDAENVPTPPGTTAQVKPGATLTAGGAISVRANEADEMHVTGGQFAGGVIGVGAAVALLSVADNVSALAQGTLNAGGTVEVHAALNEGVQQDVYDGKAGLVGIGAGIAVTGDSSQVEASLGNVNAAGAVSVTADATRDVRASTWQVSIGGVAAGAAITHVNLSGATLAHVDGNVGNASTTGASTLTVKATATDSGVSKAQAVSGGIGAMAVNYSELTMTPNVSATIAGGSIVNTSGKIDVEATDYPEGDALTNGVAAGGIALGGSKSYTRIQPTVTAHIDAASVHSGGDIFVVAKADSVQTNPPPDYLIVGVDGSNDTSDANNNTITVLRHNLQTGDTVQLSDGTGIGGLVSNATDPSNNNVMIKNVIVTDSDHLALGAAFSGASADPSTDLISFGSAHNLKTGDLVEYESPNGSTPVGNLVSGTIYKVLVVDGTHIKLQDPLGTYYLKDFTPSSGDTLTVSSGGGHGFTNGEAVTYHAPTALTFTNRQVDVDPGQPLIINNTTINDQDNNNIQFVDPNTGNGFNAGFSVGDLVRYGDVSGQGIGGLTAGTNYKVISVTSGGSSVQLGDAFASGVTYTANGAGDTITRSDGHDWSEFGFVNGQTIVISNAAKASNNGTFQIASVSGHSLTLLQKNVLTSDTSGGTFVLALDPGNKSDPTQSGTHSLIKVSDLPMTTGGLSMDGQQFYVEVLNSTQFKLHRKQDLSDAALVIAAQAGAIDNHYIGPESIDITAAGVGQQQLRLDLSGSVAAGQYLVAPGGVPLGLLSPPSGDGISTAVSNGSGGGAIAVTVNDATVDVDPKVSAYVASGVMSADGSVTISSESTTNATASAKNVTGGLVGVGTPSATANENDPSHQNAAYVATGSRILAGGDFTLQAKTLNQASATSRAITGGAVGVAVADASSTITGDTTATLKDGAVVLAGGNAAVLAETRTNQSTNANASGLGLGGDGNASATSSVGGKTQVEVGKAASIAGRAVVLSASDGDTKATGNTPLLTSIAHAEGYGAGLVAVGTASATETVNTPLNILVDADAAVTGYEGVDFRAQFNNVDSEAYAFSRSTGLFGYLDSEAHNNTTTDSNVNGASGAMITAGPRDPANALLLHDGGYDPHLAFDVNVTNGAFVRKSDDPSSPRSLALDVSSEGHTYEAKPQIDFSSNVTILSGRSPTLVVDQNGNIVTQINLTAHQSGSTIIVDNIVNDDPGDVYFAAKNQTGSDGHINGGGGTWEFRDSFERVSLLNYSKLDLQVNAVKVVNTTANPIVDIGNTGSRGLTFNIVRTVKPTLVDIENLNNDPPNVILNGIIENPIGTTRVVNIHGDILSTASRTSADSDPSSLIRTNILDLEADAGNIGQNPGDAFGQTPVAANHRINIDVVDSASVPAPSAFQSALVSGLDHSIYLGENSFFTGELVRYDASGPALGGLVSGHYYTVIEASNGLSVQLASVSDPSTPIAITPTGSLTDAHSLTAAQRFTVLTLGDPSAGKGYAYLDVKGRLRDSSTPYSVIVDAVDTTGDANLRLWGSVQETSVGTVGPVHVIDSPTGDYYNKYEPDTGSPKPQDAGVFGSSPSHIDSTYDMRAFDAAGNRWRPGITSGRNIIVAAAEPTAGAGKIVNIHAITEIIGGGTPGGGDVHHIDMLTNGSIIDAEKTGDLRVGRIMSTAGDVTLSSPARIIDALNDGIGSEADVSGVNITLTAGNNLITGTSDDKAGVGGIGTPDNFLEINVDVLYGSGSSLGVLTANDTAAGVGNTDGIFITEVVRGAESLSLLGAAPAPNVIGGLEVEDLEVGLVQTAGDVTLATQEGSIVDARNGGVGGDTAGVIGNTIDLYAHGGNIGDPSGGNDLEIDSQAYAYGTIGARATGSIDLTEALPTTASPFARDAEVVLIQALGVAGGDAAGGNVRFTVRESAAVPQFGTDGVTVTVYGEDLNLLAGGSVLFGENAPEIVSHGLINAANGSILLRVADDVNTDPNAQILASHNIDIYGDFRRVAETSSGVPVTDTGDPGYGTIMHLQGVIAHGPTANGYVTRIFGNADSDQVYFDQTFLGGDSGTATFAMPGGTSQIISGGPGVTAGTMGVTYSGGTTRVYGSNTPTPVSVSVAATVNFSPDPNGDTITRTDGGNWITDGFAIGDIITVDAGPDDPNSRSFTVTGVAAGMLTLSTDNVVTAEQGKSVKVRNNNKNSFAPKGDGEDFFVVNQ